MKFSFLSILFLAVVLVSCSKNENTENKALLIKECPRTNLEWVISDDFSPSVQELADELNEAINCGRHFNLPICEEGGLFQDEATIILETWCVTAPGCDCNSFPKGFTIEDQDALIAEAKSLMALELTTCGIENAIYEFSISATRSICDGDAFEIDFIVSATAFCCASVE